jgi:LacI family transcriptional regulator
MKRPLATLKHVALEAGVSIQTASAILNNRPGYTDETRRRVLEAAQKLHYRPSAGARSMRTRKTNTLAFIVSDISQPTLATMAGAVEDYAQRFGYNLILFSTHDDLDREAGYVRTAAERWVDGVIFVSVRDHVAALEVLQGAGIPMVAVDRLPDSYTGPSVTLDNVQAGRMAAEHLLNLGHTGLGHISGPPWLQLARERQEGFMAALAEHGLIGMCVTGEGSWDCRTGYVAMHEMLNQRPRPTGIFAANDRMAIGAIAAAREAGLRVPEDLSVVGLDDIEWAEFTQPPLTTVRQSLVELATRGADLLI